MKIKALKASSSRNKHPLDLLLGSQLVAAATLLLPAIDSPSWMKSCIALASDGLILIMLPSKSH